MLKHLVLFIVAAAIGSLAPPAFALEIRYGPGAEVVAYPISGGGAPSGFETAILHNVGVFSGAEEQVDLSSVRIDILSGDEVVQTLRVGESALERHLAVWARRQAQGRLRTHEPILQVADILAGQPIADSLQLARGSGLIVSRIPVLLAAAADRVIVTAEGETSGRPVSASLSLPILRHASTNRYVFPLRGRWLIAVGPDLHSHHRWGAAQEFALDISRFGADMRSHRGDGSRPEMYLSYGAPVLGVADGEVVAAVDEHPDADSLRRPGETDAEYEARAATQQDALLAGGFRQIVGNHVVIRHANGEYSLYAHLRAGSVRVSSGQHIVAGQVIGEVGHSGNSTEPHLHFSIQDGPDPMRSRSLPVRFENIEFWDEADGGSGVINGGQIVETN